jgi:hypothetical protein
MTSSDFQQLLDAVPFEPFTVTLTGGSTYTIDRPDTVEVTPHGAARLNRQGALWVVISLDHVVSVTYVDVPYLRGPADPWG